MLSINYTADKNLPSGKAYCKGEKQMLSEISCKIANKLQSGKYISEKEIDIYSYSIEIFLASVINLVIVIGIGIAGGRIIECLIFSAAFVPMRMMKGGLHASNHLICTIILAVTEAAMLAVIYLEICIYFVPILTLFAIINLFVKTQSENDALSEQRRAKLNKSAWIFTIICGIVIISTSLITGFTSYQFSLLYGLAASAVSNLLSKIQNRFRQNKQSN